MCKVLQLFNSGKIFNPQVVVPYFILYKSYTDHPEAWTDFEPRSSFYLADKVFLLQETEFFHQLLLLGTKERRPSYS